MFFTVLFVLSSLIADPEYSVYDCGQFVSGSTVNLFGNNVNVREAPSIDAKIVQTLPIGYPAEIISKSETMYTLNDYTTHWYNVSFEYEGEISTGYIWGGLLSIVSYPLGSDSSELFLFCISRFDEETGFRGKGRVAKNGKVLSETDFEIIGGMDFGASNYGHSISGFLLDHAGFADLENVILLSFIYEACGFTNGGIALLWTGKELIYGVKGTSVSEAGEFHHYYDIYFPDQIEGSPDYLILVEMTDEYIDDNYQRVETHVWLYYWDGKTLEQVYE